MHVKHLFSFLSLFCLVGLSFPAHALENAHRKDVVVTPHISWERPTSLNSHKVLFFIFAYGGVGRYPAELAQRYNLDYEMVYFNSDGPTQTFMGQDEGVSRAEMLIRRGDWDAFVFWACTPSSLLGKHRKAYMLVLQQVVRKGAGAIVVDGNPDAKIFKDKNKLPAPAILSYGNGMKASYYKIGKGRGVRLNNFDRETMMKPYFRYSQDFAIQYGEGWRDAFEMRLGDVYSALRWSMGKPLPPSAIRSTQQTMTLTAPADGSLTWNLSGMGDSFSLSSGQTVRKGETLSAPLPRLAPGTYLASAIIRKDGQVQAFTGLCHQQKRPTQARITAITLPKDYGIPGETIKGTIALQGQGNLMLRLRDPQRRILHQHPLTVTDGKADFQFRLERWMPYLITVEAELLQGQQILDRSYTYCHRTIQRKNRFDVMAWGYDPCSVGSLLANSQAAKVGFNELVGYAPKNAPDGLLYQPPRGGPLRISAPRNDRECWLSQNMKDNKERELSQALAQTAHRGMKRVLMGDEGPVQLGCLAKSCQDEYRNFLTNKYRDLKKLNQAWKTNFTDWTQVGLSMIPEKNGGRDLARYGKQIYWTPDTATCNHAINTWGVERPRDWNQVATIFANDPKSRAYYQDQFLLQECGSMLAGNYTRWFDRCDFRSYAMAKTMKYLDDIVARHFPGATAGLSGTFWLGLATDFDRFFGEGNTNVATTYSHYANNPVTELIDALVPPTFSANLWSGYAKTPEPMLGDVWFDILSHPNMFSIYSVFSQPPAYWGTLRPNLSVNEPMKAVLDSTRRIRNGLGDTLMRSTKMHDPVAILWSWPSTWAARLEGGDSFELPVQSFSGILRHLNAQGIRYRFMTAKQLETGKVSLKNFRYLMLPRTDAMSDQLANLIKGFAQNGGTVVADIRPAVFGPNLELLTAGKLDQAFGIKRSAQGSAFADTLNMKGVGNAKFHLDRTVTLAGATARYTSAKNIPAFITNPCGKGRFILMNFPFYELPSLLSEDFRNGSASDFLALFQDLHPVCTYANQDGSRHFGVRNVTFQNGDMTFLFAHETTAGKPHIGLTAKLRGKAKFVYDINAGKQHSAVSSFGFTLPIPEPACFVLSDQPLPPLTVAVPATAQRGQLIQVSYRVDGTMKGRRPAVLTLLRNGKPLPHFRHILMAQPEASVIPCKFAFNEKPGTYVFQLEDTLTGRMTQATLNLN